MEYDHQIDSMEEDLDTKVHCPWHNIGLDKEGKEKYPKCIKSMEIHNTSFPCDRLISRLESW
jgi:hypothetical protein